MSLIDDGIDVPQRGKIKDFNFDEIAFTARRLFSQVYNNNFIIVSINHSSLLQNNNLLIRDT